MKALTKRTLDQNLPWILAGGASIGLLAAFVLTLEKIALIKDPAHQLSCSINPVISCGSVIMSPQASAFHFPNPFLGLIGFSVVLTVAMGLFAGATYKRWFWRGLQLGTIFGILFVAWLIHEALYDIGALCLYCMAVWSVTWPIFWYTTLYNFRHKNIPTPKKLQSVIGFMQRHHADLLVAGYVAVVIMIATRFWYYWSTFI